MLTQLGLVLITAGIVAMFTAWYLKERLIQEIQGRVSDVLGEFRTEAIDAFQLQKLPHEILESVRTTLLNKPVIQRNLTTDYQMQVVQIDTLELGRWPRRRVGLGATAPAGFRRPGHQFHRLVLMKRHLAFGLTAKDIAGQVSLYRVSVLEGK